MMINMPEKMLRGLVPALCPNRDLVHRDSSTIMEQNFDYLCATMLVEQEGEVQQDGNITKYLWQIVSDNFHSNTVEFLKLIVYYLSNKLFEPSEDDKSRQFVCDEILKWFQMGDNYLVLKRILSNRIPTIDAFAEGIFESALQAQDRGISRIFLESGMNPNIKFTRGGWRDKRTALQLVIHTGNLDMAELLLDFGADLYAVAISGGAECGQGPLQIACQKGEVGIAMLLITRGAAVNMVREFDNSALQNAAQAGNLEIATLLLENGADVNFQTGGLGCALECAIRMGATEVAELLLERGANANSAATYLGNTPLQAAVMVEDDTMIERLLQLGADVNSPAAEYRGRTALHLAAEKGNFGLCQNLLEAGAHVNVDPTTTPKYNHPKTTALAAAVSSKNYQLVELLLKHGADVNDSRGKLTALETATELNDIRIVQMLLKAKANQDHSISIATRLKSPELILALLDAGADINKADERRPEERTECCSALCSAVCTNDVTFVEFLLSIGAQPDGGLSPDKSFDKTPLVAATQLANVRIMELLLNAGANLNLTPTTDCLDPNRISANLNALQTAALMGNLELVQYLLHAGAELNWPAANSHGRTALQAAVESGSIDLTQFLISKGADVNSPAAKDTGLTALQAAASRRDIGLVQLLLDAGANANDSPSPLGCGGFTALQIAAENGEIDIIKILQDNGGDVNSPASPFLGRTALQAAAEGGHYHAVELLLGRGADVNAPACQEHGYTALQAAASQGYLRIAKLLLNAGADVEALRSTAYGSTALELAAHCGRIDMLKLLLTAGANITSNGRTQFQRALKLATEGGHDAAAKFLKYHQIC
ncbi:ankyrin repeat-containing domain protein [Cadophora sp. MPI-SDFR-AT-0126]|nr:ankyrin repeat-containing domain protein [Leotiomycetes sp. MPI-SDFR-AT-0126]